MLCSPVLSRISLNHMSPVVTLEKLSSNAISQCNREIMHFTVTVADGTTVLFNDGSTASKHGISQNALWNATSAWSLSANKPVVYLERALCGWLYYAAHCICARENRNQRKQNCTFVHILLASFQLSHNCSKQWVDAAWPGSQSSHVLFWVAFLLLHLMQPFQLYKP